MNMKLSAVFIGALLVMQGGPITAQIPASELPPAGTDTGLEGKYDPQNGIAQLINDKSAESAASKIFEDEHVLVFMPLPEEEVVTPGHVLVVPKRTGGSQGANSTAGGAERPASASREAGGSVRETGPRNILDLKPDEMRDIMVAVQKAGIAQKNGLGATGFRVQSNNGLSSSQTVYHSHFHVIPSFGGKAPGTPAPRRKLAPEEYKSIADKLRAAWPRGS
jgi:diadenosine tetraphosphate (Ap4A) HIT family hydrolase